MFGIYAALTLSLYYSKTSGKFHSAKGAVLEAVGETTGSKSWTESGKKEHASGEAEVKAAQAKGYAEGTLDVLGGKKDTVVGAVTGDRQQEASGELTLYFCQFMCVSIKQRFRERAERQGEDTAGA